MKIGDRIELVDDFEYAKRGMTGTIVAAFEGQTYDWGVEFDKPSDNFHTCRGVYINVGPQTKPNHGYWAKERCMRILVPLSPLEVQIRAADRELL